MKNKRVVSIGAFFALLFAFVACSFESSDSGVVSWLSDHGMPGSYKVQTLSINDVKVASAEAFLDTFPTAADSRTILGKVSNISHDVVFDLAFNMDSNFVQKLNSSDTAGAFLALFWLKAFYENENFPKDSLPYEEDLDVKLSWKLDFGDNKKFLDSIAKIADSSWYESLQSWDDASSVDTTFKMSLAAGDTSIRFDMPSALVEDIKKASAYAHLQMRVSAPSASRGYRFYGDGSNYPPIFALFADSSTFISPTPFRMANIVNSQEECSDCPVLHGGVFDSLVVELDPEPIMKALAEFYGDEFPYTEGDSNDVRQNVILAQLTMARDDSKGANELGLPIQVVVGSFVDSASTVVRRMESYRLNKEVILEKGHQNLIFHDGDSLTVQLTLAARDFINKASDGRSMKFMMRMGYPFLQEKDTTYTNYLTEDGDSSYVFLNHFDYARYDFSKALESPMTLKLWLATKRGDEE